MFLGLIATSAFAADQPGTMHHVKASELPKPFATPAADNSSHIVPRPKDAVPQVPQGFHISVYASGLTQPRFMEQAPDGSVFLSEPDAGKVTLLHDGKASTFASGFDKPHGLAFHDGALYVCDLIAVWRVDLKDGKAGARTRVTKDGFGPLGGHFSRDIAFDKSGALYVAIGSMSNIDEEKPPRATVQKVDAQGHLSTFVSGTRNPVGLVLKPGTDDLYITVNERDGYGDGLVPDYFTRIAQGDFFGWPYAYSGPHADPDWGKKRPDLVSKTRTPDVLFQAHSAPLGIAFYEGGQFPADYKGDAFVSLHGSWNSDHPTGYKVVRVRFKDGKPTGEYQDFATGFWDGTSSPAKVWGRPVGLLVLKDGSLLIADDAGKTVWRVEYGK
ncbi:MAG: PQQ-dependent sugar dehydrogenase [Alphaproteobacteria bacterium]|nr:PQQ-dependent sugar dehydrogenase [Alphaproteobacteria bacterium]